jgi:hypothetical protein
MYVSYKKNYLKIKALLETESVLTIEIWLEMSRPWIWIQLIEIQILLRVY